MVGFSNRGGVVDIALRSVGEVEHVAGRDLVVTFSAASVLVVLGEFLSSELAVLLLVGTALFVASVEVVHHPVPLGDEVLGLLLDSVGLHLL